MNDPNGISALPPFADLSDAEVRRVARMLDQIRIQPRDVAFRWPQTARGLTVVTDGEIGILRNSHPVTLLRRGDCVGAMGRTPPKRRGGVTLHALTEVQLVVLSGASLDRLAAEYPHTALKIAAAATDALTQRLGHASATIEMLVSGRTRPLRTVLDIRVGDRIERIRSGTELGRILPATVAGDPVVAALVDGEHVSLNRPILAAARVEAVTLGSGLGRRTYRQSLCLLALEAAASLDPAPSLRIGASVGVAHIIDVEDPAGRSLSELVEALEAKMREEVALERPFTVERLSPAEARTRFLDQGWVGTVRILDTWRGSTVPTVTCHRLTALEQSPLVPHAGHLIHFDLTPHGGHLLLGFGATPNAPSAATDYAHRMATEHEHWLEALGAVDVGAVNELCTGRELDQLISVSEGYHEKCIGQIADAVAGAAEPVRVICVSGPSSSGKTTLIRRLSTQLRVNGVTPIGLSLDDYFVDRNETVTDEEGNRDFEAFEALNIPLLTQHLTAIIAGDTVRTASYDFKSGESDPEGGPTITLAPRAVLLVEGIHGLNPRLPVPDGPATFRIFCNPMTSLPIDPVTRVAASDVRLVRRIVRDRRHRGLSAADNIERWRSVRRGERLHIFPNLHRADAAINTSLVYEPAVLKVVAERYLLEVPRQHPSYTTARRLYHLLDRFVAIAPERVPANSLLREFIG